MYGFIALGTVIGASWLFPNLFWKKKIRNSDINIIFFDIEKDSENPYLVEPTVVTMYDLRKQLVYSANTKGADTINDIEQLAGKIANDHSIPIFVTCDDNGFKRACLKSMLADTEGLEDLRVMDIKSLFYYVKQEVPSVSYEDMLEFYQLAPTNTIVDYADLFTHIASDFDPNTMLNLSYVCEIYEELKRLS
jgi:hypothetical protein